jgi:hypothetical protein
MSQKHQKQIASFLGYQVEPLGWIFDQCDTLVGTIDETPDATISAAATHDLMVELHPEIEPAPGERGSFGTYYRMALALAAKGYRVIDAEGWRRKENSSYSILDLPPSTAETIELRFEDGRTMTALLLPQVKVAALPAYNASVEN